MPEITDELKQTSAFLYTCSNGADNGFRNRLLTSEKKINTPQSGSGPVISLIPYDYKNAIEPVLSKTSATIDLQFWECNSDKNGISIDALENKKSGDTAHPPAKEVPVKNYLDKVRLLKDHIQKGDIYEINYCIPFIYNDILLDPFSLYTKLNGISQAPFSALAKFDDLFIISSSPERFLQRRKTKLITQPIKGTAKRSAEKGEDVLLKEDLLESLKERTENIMIVDVARNDLSRVATKGSVTVEKLYEIQSYKQVHQMVSTVSCEIREDLQFMDIIHATFPMASMTGAPKIRAMQLSDEFEEMPRGAYSGALGYIEKDGDFDLSVLIRSIFYDQKKNKAWFWVGSAITALSDPEKEYEECLLKAKAMKDVLK